MAETNKKIKKIVVNRELCIGAASCIINAPGIFELDGENKAVFLETGGAKTSGPVTRTGLIDATTDDEAIMAAAQSCPTRAILVYDEDDHQVYP